MCRKNCCLYCLPLLLPLLVPLLLPLLLRLSLSIAVFNLGINKQQVNSTAGVSRRLCKRLTETSNNQNISITFGCSKDRNQEEQEANASYLLGMVISLFSGRLHFAVI